MPVERRIREGAERNAGMLDPDVDRVLDTVVRRTRRRAVVHRSLTAAVAIPAVVLALVFGPHLLEATPRTSTPATQPPAGQTPSTGPAVPQLSGHFTRTLSGSLAIARANGIGGTWTIATDGLGRLQLLAPRSFSGPQASLLSELSDHRFRTSAFSAGICRGSSAGTYGWAEADGVLQLTALHDRCDARVAILGQDPWRAHP